MRVTTIIFVLHFVSTIAPASSFSMPPSYSGSTVLRSPLQSSNVHGGYDRSYDRIQRKNRKDVEFHLKMFNDGGPPGFSEPPTSSSSPFKSDPIVREASLTLRRTSWISWWAQVILTSVSGITLLFAKSVMKAGSTQQGKLVPPGGFFLAGSGVFLSVLSIFWTWGGARLSRRLLRNKNPKTTKPYTRIKVATMIRRAISIGSYLNIMGMFITLIGAEQIVGLLAAKALTSQGISPFGVAVSGAGLGTIASQTLQPLDILVVQANTNTLLSHFVSLVCTLYLTRSVRRLDPPSVEDEDAR